MARINEDLLHVIENFPIKPVFNKVLITLDKLEADGDLVLSDNILSDTQYVVSKGNFVNEVNIGDKVIIDIEKMMKSEKREATNVYEDVKVVNIDQIEVDGRMYAFIDDRVIKAVDNR